MSARTEELTQRRRALQAVCEQQRGNLGAEVDALERRVRVVDQAIALMRRLGTAPLVLGLSIGAIVFIAGPRRVMRWAGRILLATSAYRRLTRT